MPHFLPPKSGARKQRLKALQTLESQLVFYEAPHRVKQLFDDLLEVFGEHRQAGIARELTKFYESLYRGTIKELNNLLNNEKIPAKGEFVVIVQGNQQSESSWHADHLRLIETLLPYLPINQVAKVSAQLTGMSRKACYDIALMLQDKIKKRD